MAHKRIPRPGENPILDQALADLRTGLQPGEDPFYWRLDGDWPDPDAAAMAGTFTSEDPKAPLPDSFHAPIRAEVDGRRRWPRAKLVVTICALAGVLGFVVAAFVLSSYERPTSASAILAAPSSSPPSPARSAPAAGIVAPAGDAVGARLELAPPITNEPSPAPTAKATKRSEKGVRARPRPAELAPPSTVPAASAAVPVSPKASPADGAKRLSHEDQEEY